MRTQPRTCALAAVGEMDSSGRWQDSGAKMATVTMSPLAWERAQRVQRAQQAEQAQRSW